jgi:hypothetical protein
MAVLQDAVMVDWLANYLSASYPRQTKSMGRVQLAGLIRRSIAGAKARSLTEPGDIRKYVNIAFLLGPDFADSPQFGWARKILDDPRYNYPSARLRALTDEMLRRIESTQNAPKGK